MITGLLEINKCLHAIYICIYVTTIFVFVVRILNSDVALYIFFVNLQIFYNFFFNFVIKVLKTL